VHLRIHDAQGRLVKEEKIARWNSGSSNLITLERQKPGIYFLELIAEGKRMSHRFVIE
jgi:hypothetical protein